MARSASWKEVAVRDLNYDLKRLQAAHDDGSHGTRTARSYALAQIADTLHDLGFKGLRATGLKRKHVVALVKEWKRQGRSIGTMKNRMAHVRWWAARRASLAGGGRDQDAGPRDCVPRLRGGISSDRTAGHRHKSTAPIRAPASAQGLVTVPSRLRKVPARGGRSKAIFPCRDCSRGAPSRAWPRTRRWRPGASARARCPGRRGTAGRGNRPQDGHSTTPRPCIQKQRFRITRPFHPLHGRQFKLIQIPDASHDVRGPLP